MNDGAIISSLSSPPRNCHRYAVYAVYLVQFTLDIHPFFLEAGHMNMVHHKASLTAKNFKVILR